MLDTKSLSSAIRVPLEQAQRVSTVEVVIDLDLPKGPIAIVFKFETVLVCLSVCGEDDTISVSDEWPHVDKWGATLHICKREELQQLLVGATLRSAWAMRNNMGYSDGFQLEFRREGEDRFVCIQFIAIASTLEMRMVVSSQEEAILSAAVLPPLR